MALSEGFCPKYINIIYSEWRCNRDQGIERVAAHQGWPLRVPEGSVDIVQVYLTLVSIKLNL